MKIEQTMNCATGRGRHLPLLVHVLQCFVEAASTQLTASVCRRGGVQFAIAPKI